MPFLPPIQQRQSTEGTNINCYKPWLLLLLCNSDENGDVLVHVYRCRDVYVLIRHPQSAQPLGLSNTMRKQFFILVNAYILDTADMLWRMRAVNRQRPLPAAGPKTFFDTVPHSVLQSVNIRHPSLTVSLFMHRAFVGFAMAFIEKVTPSFCWFVCLLYWCFVVQSLKSTGEPG